MVKRKKHDKDKYYVLARQQGYRARSAFKLIQLNKKYDFLSSARVCIDLCAAPGGWCQVAAKYMPTSSIILGIDLLPIRPIRGVKTFQCDITTAKCRQIIRQEIQSWQADVVLCDGAPNVGAEYSKDAFVQNDLALTALKLAVDVMGSDATFITKVFRSQDYNALLWVFRQLFKKVSATKPLSSRNESAEIFVVCEGYLAPHSIDPKLFDPKCVFEQVDDASQKNITIFHPKFGVQKRHRDGYDEALGVTLTNELSANEFIHSSDPIRLLTDATSIRFSGSDDEKYKSYPETSEEIVTCLNDLRVLGKGDFKQLLKWRLAMIKHDSAASKLENISEDPAVQENPVPDGTDASEKKLTVEEKEELIGKELAQLRAASAARVKRDKKKERLRLRKLQIRTALGMQEKGIDVNEAESIFSLSELGVRQSNVDDLENAGSDVCSEHASSAEDSELFIDSDSDYDEMLDDQMDKLYSDFIKHRREKGSKSSNVKRSKVSKRALASETIQEDAAVYDGDEERYNTMINPDESSDDQSEEEKDTLAVDLRFATDEPQSAAVNRWFSDNKLFDDVVNVDDIISQMPKTDKSIRKEKRKAATERKERRDKKKIKKDQKELKDLDEYTAEFETVTPNVPDSEGPQQDPKIMALIRSGMGAALKDSKDDNSAPFEVVAAAKEQPDHFEIHDERDFDSDAEDYNVEDRAKTMALASMMIRPSKAKEIVDASYNRYAWNDQVGLPSWFVDDEKKHYRPQLPIPPKLLQQMKERFLEIASKPMKKVAEARLRKKRQQLKKTQAAKKKATEIANLPDLSTRMKVKAIDKAMKGAQIKKQNKVYVVSRRGGQSSSAKKGAPKGSKVKLVDSRMKKDKRNATIREKRGKKRRR